MDAFQDSRTVRQGKLQIIEEKKVLLKDFYKMFVTQHFVLKMSENASFPSIFLSDAILFCMLTTHLVILSSSGMIVTPLHAALLQLIIHTALYFRPF